MLNAFFLPRGGFLPAALIAVATAGCSGDRPASVSGTVSINGQPPRLPGLTISFVTPGGRTVAVPVDGDGKYTAPDLVSGEVRVGFYDLGALPTDGGGPDAYDRIDRKAPAPRDKGADKGKAAATVPARLSDPLKSGVRTALNPGPNTFDFDIK